MKKSYFLKASKHMLLAALSLLIINCHKETTNPDSQKSEESTETRNYIRSLGFNDSDIFDAGDYYLVESDILFPKKAFLSSNLKDRSITSQYGTGSYINKSDITIQIDPSVNEYTDDIYAGMMMWNNAFGKIKFSIPNPFISSPDIIITQGAQPSNCAEARFPQSGNPGNQVLLNKNNFSSLTSQQRRAVIAHELGHTIGFRHTDWQNNKEPATGFDPTGAYYGSSFIPGTIQIDNNSVMNSYVCGSTITNVSTYDQIAFQYLYPPTENPANYISITGPSTLYRYDTQFTTYRVEVTGPFANFPKTIGWLLMPSGWNVGIVKGGFITIDPSPNAVSGYVRAQVYINGQHYNVEKYVTVSNSAPVQP